MSEDEVLVLVVCGAAGLFLWMRWYLGLLRPCEMRFCGERSALAAMPVVCMLVLGFILKFYAASDVRDAPQYMFFYIVMGAAWLAVTATALGMMGLSQRDDVAERSNRAAAVALAGGMLGATLAFAGGNMGDGPGWWVVVFSSGLATICFLGLWWLIDRLTGALDAVTIDRDMSTALRIAALLMAVGAVLGRSAAGNWVSVGATVRDFMTLAWPALCLVLADAAYAALSRPRWRANEPPTQSQGTMIRGLVPAVVYLAAAAAYIVQEGWW